MCPCRCTHWAQVLTLARGGCDNDRCHNKKKTDRKWDGDVNDVMSGSDVLGILVIKKKAVSWDLTLDETSWDSDLGEASPVMDYGMAAHLLGQWVEIQLWAWPVQLGLRDAPRVVGSDGTVSIVKIVCLSLLVSKNLKVKKLINVSYLNKESRQCFAGFLCIWTIYRSVYFTLFISWSYFGEYATQFVRMVKLKHSTQFQVDNPVLSRLFQSLRKFAVFVYYVIDLFVSITI